MADLIPKIIKAARSHAVVTVRCARPERMAKELRRHLPLHTVTAMPQGVLIEGPRSFACSSGPACTGRAQ